MVLLNIDWELIKELFQNETIKIELVEKSQKINYIQYVVPLISFISVIITFYQVKSVKKNFNSSLRKDWVNNFIVLVSSLLTELQSNRVNNFDKINRCQPVSEKHLLIENQLLIILDTQSKSEKEMLELITKYKNSNIRDIDGWLNNLLRASRDVIKQKNKKL